MASTIHRPGARRREAAPAARRGADPMLTIGQQEFLALHGFGPTAPRSDFGDPEVRARFVRLLRECGALAPETRADAPVSPARRHLRRVG